MKILRLLVFGAILNALPCLVQARDMDTIKQSGVVKIGVRASKDSPLGYTDEKGIFHGYDLELAKRIAKDLGVRLEPVHTESEKRILAILDDRVDDYLTQTREREEFIDFALPYMKVFLSVISPKTALISDISQLDGKILMTVSGSTAIQYLHKQYENKVKIIEMPSFAEAFESFLHGEADGFVDDNIVALPWVAEHEGYAVGIVRFGSMDVIAPGLQKGNYELMRWLNEEIRTLSENGFFQKVYEETLGAKFGNLVSAYDFMVEW